MQYERVEFRISSLKDNPDYKKCPRCWNYTHEGLHNFDGLCNRCCLVLLHDFPNHEVTQLLKKHNEKPVDPTTAGAV
jgi:hypothetical protein